ncbi:LCP family protein [Planosporangium sp. 12N6]|uniref:LCP family protein n=1 Tax=Planosporangium spinosum TaxID=3402278 RepID=UPI003CF9C17D
MSSPTPRRGSSSGRASVPSGPSAYRGSGRAQIPPRAVGHGAVPPQYRDGRPPQDPGGRPPQGPGGTPYRRRIRPRWGRIALVLALALLLLAGLGAGGAFLYYRNLDSGLQRTDAFSKISGDRPTSSVAGAQNILLLGSDSRDPDNKAKPGQWRTDTIILLHVDAAHQKAYLISLPRDLYVHIPKSPTNPDFGDTNAKINAAFAWGGVPLAVQTLENYSGVHIDHVVLVDFGGFQQVTDALGGVDMNIEQDITSIHKPNRKFTKGMQHLDGAAALDYVRQRYQFPDGDFARMRHQQEFMKALLDKATSTGTMSNPLKLNAFLKSVTNAMTVDNDFSLASTAWAFHNMTSADLTFMTSPNLGSDTVNGESVVVSDKPRALSLYKAVAEDTVAEWVAQNGTSAAKPGR